MGIEIEKLRSILDNKRVSYEVIKHDKPILTTKDGAEVFGIDPGQAAPILIMKADTGFISVIISRAKDRMDLNQLAEVLHTKHLRMATRSEVEKITGYKPGSIPLVGLNLPCFLSEELLQYEFIYGGTGNPNYTLKIKPEEIKKVNLAQCLRVNRLNRHFV